MFTFAGVLFALKRIYWFFANNRAALYALLLAIVLLGSYCGYRRYQTNRISGKLDNLNANIANAEAGKAVIEQQKANANLDARNAETESNRSRANLANVQNRNYNGVTGKQLDEMGANYK